jgi:2-alkenal reductase
MPSRAVASSRAATMPMPGLGVRPVRISSGTTRSAAGLRGVDPQTGELGDVIVGVNGQPVSRLADLTRAVSGALLRGLRVRRVTR